MGLTSSDSWGILNRNLFFVRSAVKSSEVKTSDKLDIYDPQTRQLLLECREPELGFITKAARFIGGRHDHGTKFDFIARQPGEGKPVLRVSRGNVSLSFGGCPIRLVNEDQEALGTLKKKTFTLGKKFEFSGERGLGKLLLEIKSNFLGNTIQWLLNGRVIGTLSKKATSHEDYFREGKFDYSYSIAAEVAPNDVLRQILVAFAIAQHRVEA